MKYRIDTEKLLELLDDYEGGTLFPKIEEKDTIESVQLLGADVEFTIGEEDD